MKNFLGEKSGKFTCAHDGPTLNAGLVSCDFSGDSDHIAKKPYIFVIFQEGGLDPQSNPLWIRACTKVSITLQQTIKAVKFGCD